MNTSHGPWSTAMHAGNNPQLSTFWKRRLAMLCAVNVNHTRFVRGTHSCLLAFALLMCALPTLRSAVIRSERQQPPAGKDANSNPMNQPTLSPTFAAPQHRERQVALAGQSQNKSVNKAVSKAEHPKKKPDATELERRSIHNLTLLGGAFHDYHDALNSFPAPANYDSSEKPLLSWRVHLLPYLGQKKLFRQFRLNETWDSPHNRRLVAQIPAVYNVPLRKPLAKGKTSYLVPTGEGTLFRGKQAPRFGDVRDGISSTILLVEADRKHAVPWTKPADIKIDGKQPVKGLIGHRQDGFLALFVEGASALISERLKYKSSGMQLDEETNAKALRMLFRPDDGTGIEVEIQMRVEFTN